MMQSSARSRLDTKNRRVISQPSHTLNQYSGFIFKHSNLFLLECFRRIVKILVNKSMSSHQNSTFPPPSPTPDIPTLTLQTSRTRVTSCSKKSPSLSDPFKGSGTKLPQRILFRGYRKVRTAIQQVFFSGIMCGERLCCPVWGYSGGDS